MLELKEIERSIIKKYRKVIWSKFIKAIKEFKLVEENDKIMVCISGGKDSFLLAKCMQELKKHGKINFQVCYVTMDPGYNEYNHNLIIQNAKDLGIPLEMFNTDIYDVVKSIDSKSSCYLCARMRRGHLYNKAQELGCNKIALGHHFNDVIETTLLSMFYGAEIKTMMPRLYSDNFKGIELIRPLYFVHESDIIAWKNSNKINFINCACRFVENCSLNEKSTSKRKEIKNLIADLKKINPDIDYNIYKALDNVNLNCILGTKKEGIYHSFLEDYFNKK